MAVQDQPALDVLLVRGRNATALYTMRSSARAALARTPANVERFGSRQDLEFERQPGDRHVDVDTARFVTEQQAWGVAANSAAPSMRGTRNGGFSGTTEGGMPAVDRR